MRIKLEAHAFAIWRYCERHGWDMTHAEVAEGTGLSLNEIRDAVQRKPFLKGKLGGRAGLVSRQHPQQGRGYPFPGDLPSAHETGRASGFW